jgi:hypothetical protein
VDRFECVCKDRRPLVFDAQHLGNVGTVEVKIEQAYLFTVVGEGEGRFTETVDFPTPPFPLRTRMTCSTSIFAF